MREKDVSRVRDRLLACARDYRRLGYVVTVQPGPAHLPHFLLGSRPDLIAEGPDETVLVEVKTRSTLSSDKELAHLARALEGHPGWRLELIITNPQGKSSVPEDAEVANTAVLDAHLDTARQLAQEGQPVAAMLLAWSAVEGVLRTRAREEELYVGSRGASYLIKRLYSLGFLSRDQYAELHKGLSLRNSLIHGFSAPSLHMTTVLRLIDLGRALLCDQPP